MIRYEFEEEELLHNDFKMPVARHEIHHGASDPSVHQHHSHQHQSHHHQSHQTHHISDLHWGASLEADWLNSDDPAHQVDQYAQSLLTGDLFADFEHPETFADSFLDSQNISYYGNSSTEDLALIPVSNYHELDNMHSSAGYQPHTSVNNQPTTPLRERDLNVPIFSPPKRIVVPKEKAESNEKQTKTCKPASQRRPIDEYPTKNGYKKPLFSYSCLIGLAMRNSETGELTVAEIYRFLCANFPFFQEAPSGWKNSVRHNLSLNKCFQKVDTPTPDPQGRRSCLWCINPAKEEKMTSEINKWRERCAATIEFAMTTPEDFDDIIQGRKGMPPSDEPSNPEPTQSTTTSTRRPKERPINHWYEVQPLESPKNLGVVVRKTKYENFEESAPDENLPSMSMGGSEVASSSSMMEMNSASSAHERAARTFDILLERKKLATVHPRNDENKVEMRSPVHHQYEQPLTLRVNGASSSSLSPATSSIPGPIRLTKTVRCIVHPYTIMPDN